MKIKDILNEVRLGYNKKQGRITIYDAPSQQKDPNPYWNPASGGSRSNLTGSLEGFDVVKELENTPEWKELSSIMRFASSDRELKNGTLRFASPNNTGDHVLIYATGQIRRHQVGYHFDPSDGAMFQVSSPEPAEDIKTRYINAMRRTIEYAKKQILNREGGLKKNRAIKMPKEGLETLVGMNIPQHVYGDLNLANNLLTDFEGFPSWILGDLNLKGNPYTTFTGIHKKIEMIGESIILPSRIKSSILGIYRIKGLVKGINGRFVDRQSDLGRALEIMNKHWSGRDIMECQEELIQSGLREFARL